MIKMLKRKGGTNIALSLYDKSKNIKKIDDDYISFLDIKIKNFDKLKGTWSSRLFEKPKFINLYTNIVLSQALLEKFRELVYHSRGTKDNPLVIDESLEMLEDLDGVFEYISITKSDVELISQSKFFLQKLREHEEKFQVIEEEINEVSKDTAKTIANTFNKILKNEI